MSQMMKNGVLKIDKIGATGCRSGLYKCKLVRKISFSFEHVDLSVRMKDVFINVFSHFTAERTL
jgi:hypothetical protein